MIVCRIGGIIIQGEKFHVKSLMCAIFYNK